MGMDACGIKPKNEAGESFSAPPASLRRRLYPAIVAKPTTQAQGIGNSDNAKSDRRYRAVVSRRRK
jgi:hypothetical protein